MVLKIEYVVVIDFNFACSEWRVKASLSHWLYMGFLLFFWIEIAVSNQ